jgi:signal transduction histidine kinase
MSETPPAPAHKSSRWGYGIRSRLYSALAGAVTFTLIASIIAWIAFLEIDERQHDMIVDILPAQTISLRLAQQTTTITALAPKLLAFDNLEERERSRQQIAEERRRLQQSMTELQGLIKDQNQLRPITVNIETLALTLEQLDRVATDRFDLEQQLRTMAAQMQSTHRELNLLLAPVLDDIAFFVITGYRKLGDTRPASLQERTAPAQLLIFEELSRLSAEANLMLGLLNGAVHVPQLGLLATTRERFDAAAGRTDRALQSFEGDARVAQLIPSFKRLEGYGMGTRNLFELRRQVLERQQNEQALIQTSRQEADSLTAAVRAMAQNTERAATSGTEQIQRALHGSEWLLLALNIVSVLGALLIAWLFVERGLMRRLAALVEKMRDMAAGNITVPVKSSGRDEVTEMAKALEIFRAQALEARRLNLVEKLANELNDKNAELQTALDELRAAQDRIVTQEKLASLGQLTAGIAHEIKNPLNFVNNFSGISVDLIDELRDHLGKVKESLDDDTREDVDELFEDLSLNLQKIKEHGQRADGIVRGMLDHSRESTGAVEETDVNKLLAEFVGLAYHGLRAQDSSFNVTLEQDYDPAIKPIPAVRQDLSRAFLNLVTNALQAVQERADAQADGFEPKVSITTKHIDDHIEIRIRDNGVGVPDDVAEKIFMPFFTTKAPGSGTGLGLSITHDIIVKQHGGSIHLDSEKGAYTEFIIELPEKSVAAA